MAQVDKRICLLGLPTTIGFASNSAVPAKAFQLCAFLALNRNKQHSRKFVSSLLWDNASEETTLTNLRQLLARIRHLLPGDEAPLVADKTSIAFKASATAIDLIEIETLLESAELEDRLRGLEMFRGDLLEFALDLTPQFQEWLTIERASLRETFFAGCAIALKDLTRYGQAPAHSMKRIERMMLAFEPEREASYRTLIEAYGRVGEFDEFRTSLPGIEVDAGVGARRQSERGHHRGHAADRIRQGIRCRRPAL